RGGAGPGRRRIRSHDALGHCLRRGCARPGPRRAPSPPGRRHPAPRQVRGGCRARRRVVSSSAGPRPEDDVEMSFFDHLGELRKRLIRVLIGMLPGVAVGWYFKEWLLDLLVKPLVTAWRQLGLGEPSLHFANPVDPFLAYLQLALVSGLLMSAPWVFYQLWAFIAPGLYRREKRLAIPFVVASTVCFVGGALFGYFIVFPMGFETLLSFAGVLPSDTLTIQPTLMINEYLSFATRL